ncbi:hypothetical protein [Thiorhodococcus minor]|uniref:DUF4412 domain-containing protein n=1 Tax=Thiorhodococcus minor TaxID=57489 RepID=A0A6M0JTC7_9GAMM|nr:hypothetical protein [Thiorhodococcus minor]NEV60732.1 hypothetical protein [Thiorhodococcus minor]
MRIQKRLQLAAVLGAALTVSAQAEIAGTQFSADMVSRGPDGQSTTGKMYVGDDRMRVEMSQQGRDMVRITDQKNGMEWILFPEQKGYMEREIPQDARSDSPMSQLSAEANPCEGVSGLVCRKAGQEEVAGRPAIKWEMKVERDGQTATGAQWIDVERGLPLKYQMPNGQSMELEMLGSETIDGRPVEKWQMTTTVPNKQPVQTFQWYDPELKLSVREEFPGGFVRELDNIRVGDQPDARFQVPEGYTKMDQPPQR